MEEKKFSSVGAFEHNKKWDKLIQRENKLYNRSDDIRSEFFRDYNRILHSYAYRRLKHKTQVFFATGNDHTCTRIEHVNHVAAVSYTISNYLGLNTELTRTIAIGHDLGHAPFGHEGETILNEIAEEKVDHKFWHEGNSLWFIDNIETLPDPNGWQNNLDLTYGVRDGIVLHCGEKDENEIFPREDYLDLSQVQKASQYSPYTWEGCVVKISDKISYLGRDIEDAITYKILSSSQLEKMQRILKDTIDAKLDLREINNTVLMHKFIIDLCDQSSPEKGLKFSRFYLLLMEEIKRFNNDNIYNHPRLDKFKKYVRLIIESIFNTLMDLYQGYDTLKEIDEYKRIYPLLMETFEDWIVKYTDIDKNKRKLKKYENKLVYNIDSKNDYIIAIIHYISGMTDNFAIKVFQELISF